MDARIGRRWNRDPIFKEWESPYAVLSGNPIRYVDPSGADATQPDPPEGWVPSTKGTPEVFGKASLWSRIERGTKALMHKVITPAAIFIGGAMNAHASNASLGLHERIDPDLMGAQSTAFSYGQTTGDVASIIQGAIEFQLGVIAAATGPVGGVVLAPVGGVSVVVGGAIAVGVAAVAAHGAVMGGIAAQNIIDDINRRSHDRVKVGEGVVEKETLRRLKRIQRRIGLPSPSDTKTLML